MKADKAKCLISRPNNTDLCIPLARLDERLKALDQRVDRSDEERTKAIKLSANELARRLDELNHAHARSVELQAKFLTRELFEANIEKLLERVVKLEGEFREQRGRLWLPMVIAASAAAALAAGVAKLF